MVCTRGHGKMVSVVGWLDKREVSLYLFFVFVEGRLNTKRGEREYVT